MMIMPTIQAIEVVKDWPLYCVTLLINGEFCLLSYTLCKAEYIDLQTDLEL